MKTNTLFKKGIRTSALTFAFIMVFSHPVFAAAGNAYGNGGVDLSFAGAGKFIWPVLIVLFLLVVLILYLTLAWDMKVSFTVVDDYGKTITNTIKKMIWKPKDNITVAISEKVDFFGMPGTGGAYPAGMSAQPYSFAFLEMEEDIDFTNDDAAEGEGRIVLSKRFTEKMIGKTIIIEFKGLEPMTFVVEEPKGERFVKCFEINVD